MLQDNYQTRKSFSEINNMIINHQIIFKKYVFFLKIKIRN